MTRRREAGEAGFTLIELMISLGLFALIAVAGLALVDGILRVNGRTGARLDRLAALQRTMFVLTSDLDQMASGTIEGRGDRLAFTRSAPGTGGVATPVRYAVAGGVLVRAAPAPQLLLPGVVSARWRFWDGGWIDRWPIDGSKEAKERWPRAIALDVQAAGPGGAPVMLRRVVTLPVRAQEPTPQ
ncbi:prepilin-type N-terminal cleavage/methylation domain-containing protein [Sphingomonas sp. TDK1]|uniref:prepilin-type N-terminal cleavage/methylation domain-containing protein n=1 Tax=Sphingomonas sp. TDK1 TaxID=453247 RepID=UPI0007D97492|nr:prepilin-type N-terminal cleavage/methylation domain-containing protein [Sphingomonas sp. TDK1]OAN57245.1 prepilin-type N-terminal cleavage/methylation domain-containing protein [Sphingomonas sp. TDK1]